jgi:hypothetical protein
MGKGIVPEELPNYRGCYAGSITIEGIAQEVKKADLIIELGSIKSDFNTGGFTYSLDQGKTISLHSFATKVFYADYDKVSMVEFLPLLTNSLNLVLVLTLLLLRLVLKLLITIFGIRFPNSWIPIVSLLPKLVLLNSLHST